MTAPLHGVLTTWGIVGEHITKRMNEVVARGEWGGGSGPTAASRTASDDNALQWFELQDLTAARRQLSLRGSHSPRLRHSLACSSSASSDRGSTNDRPHDNIASSDATVDTLDTPGSGGGGDEGGGDGTTECVASTWSALATIATSCESSGDSDREDNGLDEDSSSGSGDGSSDECNGCDVRARFDAQLEHFACNAPRVVVSTNPQRSSDDMATNPVPPIGRNDFFGHPLALTHPLQLFDAHTLGTSTSTRADAGAGAERFISPPRAPSTDRLSPVMVVASNDVSTSTSPPMNVINDDHHTGGDPRGAICGIGLGDTAPDGFVACGFALLTKVPMRLASMSTGKSPLTTPHSPIIAVCSHC